MMPGDEIGDFRIIGAVVGRPDLYRAVHVSEPRRVWLKVAPADGWRALASDLLRAVSLVDGLDHAGIGRIVDRGALPGGRPWFAAEMLDGVSLGDLIGRRRLAPSELASLLRDAAEILAHAHARGVLHRQLTPASIVMTSGTGAFPVGIADWGGVGVCAAGATIYKAPEREVTGRADVYSLGVIAYRALTGAFPTRDAVAPVGPVGELIARMCQPDPAARPTAAEVVAAAVAIVGERVLDAPNTYDASAAHVAVASTLELERRVAPHAPHAPMIRRPRWTPAPIMSSELAGAQLRLIGTALRRSS